MPNKTLLLSTLLLAGASVAAPLPKEIIEQVDGARVVVFLQDSEIRDNPQWQPLSGPPPVTIEALARTLQGYAARHASLADASLTQIELKPIPHHADSWHYLAVMNTHQQSRPKAHYFVVLMNGQVYPAIEEPNSVR